MPAQNYNLLPEVNSAVKYQPPHSNIPTETKSDVKISASSQQYTHRDQKRRQNICLLTAIYPQRPKATSKYLPPLSNIPTETKSGVKYQPTHSNMTITKMRDSEG